MTKTAERFDAFDIVVVPFPYADRLAEKRRPALVISNRKLVPFGLIWVAMITSADNNTVVVRRHDRRSGARRPARAIRGAHR
jgi:mRNA-degrading endonuclease toxin of MazEF toxin-antitoxin module